ncbi:MAP kinase-activated protein kinase 5-like [Haliotis rufescens]|uniref:MAP kinase-activated protein kinase 5-like n=1 Tax=Haliotis rufescens TaxID=6454 RepID=UPI00201F9A80|nr:MAP kinase-activated protein kinase 5-like [Haliotis rufescens]
MTTEEATLSPKTTAISDDYDVNWHDKLGTGINGPVRSCRHKVSGVKYALKSILDSSKARREVHIHSLCRSHPNIVGLQDVYANKVRFSGDKESKAQLLLVLELMDGGELFDRIIEEQCLTERECAGYLKQIAEAVYHCHSLNIAHRDLKPENLLLTNATKEATVKLSDFGFAKFDDGDLKTPHFTPYYVAPQVLEAQNHLKNKTSTPKSYTYDKSCDMWSMGVILYIMLCGYPPFYSETPSRSITTEMKRKILNGDYEFPEQDWERISESAKDIIRGLLHVDPSQRMTISDLLHHPWLHDASDNKLHSPAVIASKESFEDVKIAHAEHLTKMRMSENQLTLKPLVQADNPIIRKRKRRNTSGTDVEMEEEGKRLSVDITSNSVR